MNIDIVFDIMIAVVFSMSTQPRWLEKKPQDLVISFCLGEGENIPQFNLRYIQALSEIFCCNMKQDK